MTENNSPTHDLAAFKAAMANRKTRLITGIALKDAAALGYDSDEIAKTVQTMQPGQFYKSMTSYHDHKIWHDVYHVPDTGLLLYVKFTADPDLKLLSFKEK
jgi:motility quorum-sensing regulator/GCU-specific mRNA interferase toxin